MFSTLVVGIAHMEDSAAIGRVGIKTLGWFMLASLVSLTLGLIMVHLLHPGTGLALPAPTASADVAASGFSLKDFIAHLVPSSIFDAMARNEILQIVVFSVFVGSAVSALDGKAPLLLAACEQAAMVMLKITGYVMVLAPLVVFAALASTIAAAGLGIVVVYAKFVGGFYLSLGLLLVIGVDHLLDMGRSATNVVGNSVAAVIVSRWEKQLGPQLETAAVLA